MSMDMVAKNLRMSKRTLYEIFGSKEDMIRAVLNHNQSRSHSAVEAIIASSSNIMEAMVRIINFHRQLMMKVSPAFFRDMDGKFKHLRSEYDGKDSIDKIMFKVLTLGMRQGVVRQDLNIPLQIHLLKIQMEALKRMEENFPPGIPIAECMYCIQMGFLRIISTAEGVRVLEKTIAQLP